jgi:hypothetical protein
VPADVNVHAASGAAFVGSTAHPLKTTAKMTTIANNVCFFMFFLLQITCNGSLPNKAPDTLYFLARVLARFEIGLNSL